MTSPLKATHVSSGTAVTESGRVYELGAGPTADPVLIEQLMARARLELGGDYEDISEQIWRRMYQSTRSGAEHRADPPLRIDSSIASLEHADASLATESERQCHVLASPEKLNLQQTWSAASALRAGLDDPVDPNDTLWQPLAGSDPGGR